MRLVTLLVLVSATAFASPALSGAALDGACRDYVAKAVAASKEWEQLGCAKKLQSSFQVLDSDVAFQQRRCLGSVGTTIDADLQTITAELAKCRGVAGAGAGSGSRPPPPVAPPPPAAGAEWELVVVNSADLQPSQLRFRIPSLGAVVEGTPAVAGGPALSGSLKGPVFEGVVTDATGYRATLVGRQTKPDRVEGTGCDNRGRSYSFTMTRRR